MRLADAVEQWARLNRPRLDDDEKDRLRKIWRLVRYDDVGAVPVHDMTVDDAERAMALFEGSTSPEIAVALNKIVQWGRTQPRKEGNEASQVSSRPVTDRPRPRPRSRSEEATPPPQEHETPAGETAAKATLFLTPSAAAAGRGSVQPEPGFLGDTVDRLEGDPEPSSDAHEDQMSLEGLAAPRATDALSEPHDDDPVVVAPVVAAGPVRALGLPLWLKSSIVVAVLTLAAALSLYLLA